MTPKKDGRLVWSSDGGSTCPDCAKPLDACSCRAAASGPAGDGAVRLSRETKGRRGKAVTVIRGAPLDAAGLVDLAGELKKLCGTGGTVKDGAVEIQGDQRERVEAALVARGYRVKRVGG